MTWLFEIEDISGRQIHLSKERWHHIQKHSLMSSKIQQIQETLQKPDALKEFVHDANVRFYFRWYKRMKQYLFISVKYLNGDGFIITSFYTDKIK
jgi:hypothetical protein